MVGVELFFPMPAKDKIELKYSLDPSSPIAKFKDWYEIKHTKIDEKTGRKRKGDFRLQCRNYLEQSIDPTAYVNDKDRSDAEHFSEQMKQFREDQKLPQEVADAKNNLSDEDFNVFYDLWKKKESTKQKRAKEL